MANHGRVIPMPMRQNGHRRAIIDYVRHRLREECQERGKASEIARATKLSTAHITNVQKSERGVGEDAARTLATYWGLTYTQLEEEALRWDAARAGDDRSPPSSARGRGTWGDHPRWSTELALAQTMRSTVIGHVPERYLTVLAGAVVPERDPTAALILRLAESLFVTESTDAASEQRKVLAERSPGSRSEPGPRADSGDSITKTKGPVRR